MLVAVHILMLKAFVGPRPFGKHGCHIDDNKDNNTLGNLEWNTPYKNLQSRFINHGGPKLDKFDIPIIKALRRSGLNQPAIADRLGVTQGHISRILNGLTWHYV